MVLGIQAIASYLPQTKIDNIAQGKNLNTDEDFVRNKIGALTLPQLSEEETVVAACKQAFIRLQNEYELAVEAIDCVVCCTQNPDYSGLPHNSALLHAALGLDADCACFDIGLGCTGYVHGISIIQAFMNANGLKCGLFFTCDPYSRIINRQDKNTSLLFGDAATVTLISEDPIFVNIGSSFATKSDDAMSLAKNDGELFMNGRAVFNFALQFVPQQIQRTLDKCEMRKEEIDLFLLHQGSKFMLENALKRLDIEPAKAPVEIEETGNTVSSSIPILLQRYWDHPATNLLLSGFGVGLACASSIYKRVKRSN